MNPFYLKTQPKKINPPTLCYVWKLNGRLESSLFRSFRFGFCAFPKVVLHSRQEPVFQLNTRLPVKLTGFGTGRHRKSFECQQNKDKWLFGEVARYTSLLGKSKRDSKCFFPPYI